MAQILSQWSGAGSITLYAPDLFKLLGIEGENYSLLVTALNFHPHSSEPVAAQLP